jgi:hypothetical protein
MRHDESPGGGIFELTVQGTLGPVLRCATRPGQSVDEPHTCTSFRATAPDVVQLVRTLDSHGLVIESVWRLAVREDDAADGTDG